jgi:uncharacterized membrane protein YoaK (UPF0700 family)
MLEPEYEIRLGATFITGTLVSLGRGLGKAMVGSPELLKSAGHAALWCSFVGGATLVALSHFALEANALLLPAALSALAALSLGIY